MFSICFVCVLVLAYYSKCLKLLLFDTRVKNGVFKKSLLKKYLFKHYRDGEDIILKCLVSLHVSFDAQNATQALTMHLQSTHKILNFSCFF